MTTSAPLSYLSRWLQRAGLALSTLLLVGCAGVDALQITTQPPGAKLYVNGKYMGVTPKTVPSAWVAPNTREPLKVDLVKEGYQTRHEIIDHEELLRRWNSGQAAPFGSQYGLGSAFPIEYPLDPISSSSAAAAPPRRNPAPRPKPASTSSAPKSKPAQPWR